MQLGLALREFEFALDAVRRRVVVNHLGFGPARSAVAATLGLDRLQPAAGNGIVQRGAADRGDDRLGDLLRRQVVAAFGNWLGEEIEGTGLKTCKRNAILLAL